MKSSSYYSRKAAGLRECGHWAAANECSKMASKARRIEKKHRATRFFEQGAYGQLPTAKAVGLRLKIEPQ
jgi:hypothetical protein